MRLKAAIAAQKKVLDWGKWRDGGKVPRSAFFLVKSNQFTFGKAYRWRVLKMEALGESFRLLIAYNPKKEQYYAYLGMESDSDMKLLLSYEFHGSHPGWHVHSACGDLQQVPVGRIKGPWNKRVPKPRLERRVEYKIDGDEKALYVACEAFRIRTDANGNQMRLT